MRLASVTRCVIHSGMGRFEQDPETGRAKFASRKSNEATVGRREVSAALTPDERAEINANRSPSARLTADESTFCNGRTGPKAKHPFCRKPAGWETKHPGVGLCKDHGGNTPAGLKSAARTRGRQIIAQRKAEYDLMSVEHPDFAPGAKFGGDRYITNVTAEEALLEEVRRSVAMVRYLEEKIGSWSADDLPTLVSETSRGAASTTDEAAWLLLYREERAHMVRTSKLAIDAGIAERMVRIAEDQGRLLANGIKAVLQALNLSPDQARLVPTVVPGILRTLSQGQPLPALNAAPAPVEPLPRLTLADD